MWSGRSPTLHDRPILLAIAPRSDFSKCNPLPQTRRRHATGGAEEMDVPAIVSIHFDFRFGLTSDGE
jgi:hypothetical protein